MPCSNRLVDWHALPCGMLNHDRMHRLPGRQRLHHILAESRKYQNEVSTQLAEQVLAALFELLKGFEAADEESRGQLLSGLRNRPDRTHEIYEGLLTVLMRLVFLLYAKEREMFPADELFVRNYSLSGLFERLVEDEGHHPDTMDQRFGAGPSSSPCFAWSTAAPGTSRQAPTSLSASRPGMAISSSQVDSRSWKVVWTAILRLICREFPMARSSASSATCSI